ncbi:hypothetical protein BWQ96_07639 [Gracilariopsis chorda]|uniref:Uncharacterized protein n=1 Tax=Gracilariopsis chorda TaxID=448386 RepID=A0A2V3IKL6_9FLOR|nr:hypothetical protein BWQ96_07639 [Gracilariopsis chorda]|eukprot:PXF42635.1 hypothetical protein BWQ96_07639 [Gracilariopsis chorda]
MASDSDMESVSISELESEGEDEITPRVTSQPAPSPPRQPTVPQLPLSQPPTKRMTMRDRAAALREARMRREHGKSGKNSNHGALEIHDEKNGEAHVNTTNEDVMPLKSLQVSRKDPPRKKVSKKASSQTDDDVLLESAGSKNDTEHLRSSGTGRSATAGSKSGTSKGGRGKKSQSRKDDTSGKASSAQTNHPSTTQQLHEELQSEPNTLRGHASSHQHPPLKGGARSQKASTAKRVAEKKRKAVAVSQGDGNTSDANTDIVVLETARSAPPTSRQPKKAKLDKSKSTGLSKTTGKSQSKKKTTASEQASAKVSADDTEGLISPQHVKGQADPNDDGPKAAVLTSGKKKVSKKSARELASAVDEDELIVVDEIHTNEPGSKYPSKAHKGAEKVLAVQPVSPTPPRRGRGRPRKHPKPETVDPESSGKAAVVGRPAAKLPKDQGAPASPRHSPRAQATKGRKGKQLASVDLEKEQGTDDDDVVLLHPATPSVSLHRTGSKLKKRSPPARAAKKGSASQPEEVTLSGEDVEMTDVPKPKEAVAGDKEGHLNEGNRDSALQSVAKKKRVSIMPGPSPRGLRPKTRTEMTGAGRRQSLSHEEALSRLTAVVDQLQHNGEAFLHTQHRVCDQLAPSPLASQTSIVSYLTNGTDRKAIADASLRDAITHAKLVYQRNQRAAISELAENLVKAMQDWKNEKNAFLRDMIPMDLRPKPAHGLDEGGASFHTDNDEASEQVKHGETSKRASGGDDAGTGATVARWKAQEGMDTLGNDEEIEDDINEPLRQMAVREVSEGVKLMPAGFTESRKAGVNRIPVMKKVDELKKFVGRSYDKLRLGCYRSSSILKLCENVGGLTFDELYDKTPIGRAMLKKKIINLMDKGYLLGETLEGDDGEQIELFYTAPHISEKI